MAYVDAIGNVHNDLTGSNETTADDGVRAIPLTGTETTLGIANTETWYVVMNSNTDENVDGGLDVKYQSMYGTSTIQLLGNVHLILADGATMEVVNLSAEGSAISTSGATLTVYGQGGQTEGALTVRAFGRGIFQEGDSKGTTTINGGQVTIVGTDNGVNVNGPTQGIAGGDVIINGGTVNINGATGFAISVDNVTINGGTVKANVENSTGNGISATNVTINGGQVEAIGFQYGIYSTIGDITLGWTKPTDYIKANTYFVNENHTVKVVDGKALKYTDGNNNTVKLIGTLDVTDLASMTLTPYGICGYCGTDDTETTDVDESKTLTWDIALKDNAISTTDFATTLNIEGTGAMADYTATDTPWKNQTINLILVADETAYNAYADKLNTGDKAKLAPQTITVAKNASGWGTFCHGYPVSYSLSEGATAHGISGLNDAKTAVTISDALDAVAPRTSLLLNYTGTGNVTLTAQPTTATTFENTNTVVSTTGTGYTFYGNAGTADIAATDANFIKVNDDEITSYLLRNGVFVQVSQNTGLKMHRCLLNVSGSTGNAPQMLTIELGSTGMEEVVKLGVQSGVKKDDSWYSLDGRRLDGMPTAKGIYINRGVKVVVK